jgi:dihydroxy-acid dehydratase
MSRQGLASHRARPPRATPSPSLTVKERRISFTVIKFRRSPAKSAPPPSSRRPPGRGYARLYAQEILGADEGCDFAFLKPR